jgi:glycosyltransferase involved in cell wall biosynthesis
VPEASLIISVYKKTRELELILYALSIQSYKNFEVIIAEDGRDDNVKKLTESWRSKNIFPIIHLDQEDKGFRKNKILNEAIRKSNTGYLVFIDGDCIPHPEFIESHVMNRSPGTVLCGRRVNLTKKISDEINKEMIVSRSYTKFKVSDVIFSALNRDKINFNIEEGLKIKNTSVRKLITNEDEHILGCNFSISKELIEGINGFDENYTGPGLGEDSDIEFRLRLIDAKFRSVRNLAILYHLYHGKTIEAKENMEYFLEVKKRKEYFCKNGLTKI